MSGTAGIPGLQAGEDVNRRENHPGIPVRTRPHPVPRTPRARARWGSTGRAQLGAGPGQSCHGPAHRRTHLRHPRGGPDPGDNGTRAGRPVGFPQFKTRRRAALSVRFATGTIRIEPDRKHVALPRLGRLKLHESTRKLARRIEAGTARVAG